MTASKSVSVGLVGLGSMGRNHLRVLSTLPGVRLAAVADPRRELAESAASGAGATPYADAESLLRDARVDALVVASPTLTHADVALCSIDAGVPALVEKPLAATPEQAARVVQASEAAGVPIQVGHIERFNPAVGELGTRIREGLLGDVYAVSSRRAGPMPGRIRDVGVTVDLATHDVDILCWVTGERPLRVSAETARRVHSAHEDLLFGTLTFPSGTLGTIDVNWLTPTKRRWLTVLGSSGMFELDYLTQRLVLTRMPDLDKPTLIAGFAPTFSGESEVIPVPAAEPLAAELDAFLDVIRTGATPRVPVRDGEWAVILADALLRSAREARTVPVAAGVPA